MKRGKIKRDPAKIQKWQNDCRARQIAKQQSRPREGQQKPLKRNRHMKPVSAKGRTRREAYKAVRIPFMEAHPICQCCEYRPATQCHHKKRRLGKLLTDVKYFAALCHECHHHIHYVDPDWAYANGWLIGQDAVDDREDLEEETAAE